ncbi:MAG: hypothetical protein ACRD9S_00345 [Pyrinomonadaceae bacterium]
MAQISRQKRYWLRFGLMAAAAVVFAVIGIEALHHRTWHHYFWFGIHTHILRESVDIAIPGVSNMYAVTATNYTPLPILMHACKGPSDVSPFYEITYRYQVEKWESASGTWSKIMAIPPECPDEDLVTKAFGPGETMEIVEMEATGARDGLHNGDLVRFTVFTSFNDSDDDWKQRPIISPAFIIEDEKLESEIPFRVRH